MNRYKLAILALTLSAAVAAAGERDPEKIKLGLNNASHEFVQCAAYFLIVSVAFENSKKPTEAGQYKKISDDALGYAYSSGKTAGLLEETTAARFEMEFVGMSDRIGKNTSNISILGKDYAVSCKYAMENPAERIDAWVAEVENR